MNTRKSLILLALGILAFVGCKNQPGKANTELDSVQNDSLSFHKTVSLKNISFEISTSGEGSLRQLYILPNGLSIDNRKLTHQLDGKVIDAEIEDLNSDGYPELVIYIQSAGSGSYGDVIAYSVNNGKSVSSAYLPPITDHPEASLGYMGHDEFTIIENSLARRFPIFWDGDTNSNPTGGLRQIQYKLVDGEASRRFEVNKITDYPPKN
jgi:hypothetical protein